MSGPEAFTYRLDLCYQGSPFCGWARQKGRLSVEGALLAALVKATGEAPQIRVAGRTDAGVHARRQVTSFQLSRRLSPARLARAVEALTPVEVGVLGCWEVPSSFDARRCACARAYRYFVHVGAFRDPFTHGFAWHISYPLDSGRLSWAAEQVVGRHDFRAFTPAETEHVFFQRKVLSCSWTAEGPLLWLDIEADAFLRHMVRIMVGSMVEVARGRMGTQEFAALLRGAHRTQAGPTAPPQGLFLWDVRYGDEREDEGGSGLTPRNASTIMPARVSRRCSEDLFGKTR